MSVTHGAFFRNQGTGLWDQLATERAVHIEIASRHGTLETGQTQYLHDKAEKLVKYFDRLMSVEVAVDHGKHFWEVEIRASAEHKHDFFAKEEGPTPEAAMDSCVHKVEEQLRRYKDKVQHHKGDPSLSRELE